MNIVDILFTAGGGGIFGSILHLGTSWLEHKQKVEMIRVQVEAAEKTEAWKAFAESQKEVGLEKLPTNTPAWVGSLYVAVEAFRRFTRPALTWAAIGILIFAYLKTGFKTEAMFSEISFGAWTAIFWWFGSRYSGKGK